MGFKIIFKNRKTCTNRRSGGLAVAIRTRWSKHCLFHNTTSKAVQWFTISKKVLHIDKDILFGCVYVPPASSKYSNIDMFTEIEDEMMTVNTNGKYVCMLGDFNARTGKNEDFVSLDLDTATDVDEIELSVQESLDALRCLENHDIPKERYSLDTGQITHYGYRLLETCRSHNLFIANGRIGADKGIGNVTCKNVSLVDYVICSAQILSCMTDLDVMAFDALFSDAHSGVTIRLWSGMNNDVITQEETVTRYIQKVKRWDATKTQQFTQNIDMNKIVGIQEQLRADNVDLNVVCDQLCDVLTTSAANTMGTYVVRNNEKRKDQKAWFNATCKTQRKVYRRARNHYLATKTLLAKADMTRVSRQYKNTMRTAQLQYKRSFQDKLRKMRSSNTKDYWSMLKPREDKGERDVSPGIDGFFKFFKDLNKPEDDVAAPPVGDDNDNIPVEARELLNKPFTEEEIEKAAKSLKSGKSPGQDDVLNEYIKESMGLLLPTYTTLFNTILDSGRFPESWGRGVVIPIYKNKGSKDDPANYRGITLLSCIGKFFTCVINNRLTQFADILGLISENQAGFRKQHSTIDHVFVIKNLVELYMLGKKKLYCAFVDYAKAFDSIWRDGLWVKLLRSGITGKMFELVQNIYKYTKSCVRKNGDVSQCFIAHRGVRQGENLSPLLFAIYVNDLEQFLSDQQCLHLVTPGVTDIETMIKLLVLMYADDTVLFADSPEELQKCLNVLEMYCKEWRLSVNVEKTKILIFSRRKVDTAKYSFMYMGSPLENVYTFKYLGILFSHNGSFAQCRKQLYEQGTKAMYALIRRGRQLSLPVDILLDLFMKTVVPVITYGSEIWGYENLKLMETLQLRFLKYILHLNRSTSNCMVYGELGAFPIEIGIKARMVKFWAVLNNGNTAKYSSIMCDVMQQLYNNNSHRSPWLKCIHSILNDCGLSNVWETKASGLNITWLTQAVTQRLKDQFVQSWFSDIERGAKCINYRLCKTQFKFEEYLTLLPPSKWIPLCKFRTVNHMLPVEKGRHQHIERHHRYCEACNMRVMGDEYHFVLQCPRLRELRRRWLGPLYLRNINTFKYGNLFNNNNKSVLVKLANFIIEGTKAYFE